MVLVPLYTRSARLVYSSPVLSLALLFRIFVLAITYVPPFFIAYAIGEFWQYESTYREQPDVHYRREAIVYLGGCQGQPDRVWSTYRNHLDMLYPETVVFPTAIVREDDVNSDGLNDKLYLRLQFPVDASNPVCTVRMLLFFDVKLSLLARVHMQSLTYISSSWSAPSHRLWVGGDLRLQQTLALPSAGITTTYNVSLVDGSGLSSQDYEFVSILSRYMDRNITTALSVASYVWEPGSNSTFNLELEIHYIPQLISYRPGFWQLVKFAWIQYLAVLVIFYVVFEAVSVFVFNNQIIRTVVSSRDIRTKQS